MLVLYVMCKCDDVMNANNMYYVYDIDDSTIEQIKGRDIYRAYRKGIEFENVWYDYKTKRFKTNYPELSIFKSTPYYDVCVVYNDKGVPVVHIFYGSDHYFSMLYRIIPYCYTRNACDTDGSNIRGYFCPPIIENNKLVMYVFTIKYGKFVFESKEDCETSRWFKHEKGICNKVKKELILGGR